MHKYPVRYKK